MLTDRLNERSDMWFIDRYGWSVSIVVCAIANLLLIAGIWWSNKPYLFDEGMLSNPDARHYVLLGKNLVEHGVFSRCRESPFVPDMLRTPGFPIVIAAVWKCGGVAAIYLATAAMHLVNCGLLYSLTKLLYGSCAAFWASLLLATDVVISSYNFSAMAENPFLTPLLLALLLLVRFTIPQQPQWWLLIGGAIALGTATLIRPTTLYLGPLLGGLLLIRYWWDHRIQVGVKAAAIITALSLIPIFPWIVRNYFIFGIPKATTVDTNNLVYFVGAGAFQLQRGVTLLEAQEQIASEYALPPYHVAQNAWASEMSPAEIESKLKSAAPRVLTRYPLQLAASCLIGMAKATVSHSVEFVAELLHARWTPPGFASLIRLDESAWRTLFANSPLLVALFIWQMLHVSVAFVSGAVGIITARRFCSVRFASLLVFLVLAYLYATIMMFGMDAFYRCRIPAMPVLYVFSGLGIAVLTKRIFCRSATFSVS